jgi:hypothetical protein
MGGDIKYQWVLFSQAKLSVSQPSCGKECGRSVTIKDLLRRASSGLDKYQSVVVPPVPENFTSFAHKESTNWSWSDAIVQVDIAKNSNPIFYSFIAETNAFYLES